MAFVLRIEANEIAAGLPAAQTDICFDEGISRNITPRVLTAAFGDGYEQTVADGLNPIDETINASFSNREASEIYLLQAFLDSKVGKSFTILLPDKDGDQTIKVRAQNYSLTYISSLYHNLTTVLKRVYVP